MIGVLLAGGHATRLPNKVLLPCMADGKVVPLFANGIKYLQAQRCRRIIVADQPDSLLAPLVDRFVPNECVEFFIDDHAGLLACLRSICLKALRDGERMMVVCADNVYPDSVRRDEHHEVPPDFGSHAAVREVQGPAQLDWYNPNGHPIWNTRAAFAGKFLALSTPWVFEHSTLVRSSRYENILDWFNGEHVSPWRLHSAAWADLGTPESFKHYWEHQ